MINTIYKISNNINNKIYVGSAKNFKRRKATHLSCLKSNKHHSTILQNHVNKHGIESLVFEVLESNLDVNDLIEYEQKYIDKLDPFFNICKKAGSRLGIRHTKDSIHKMVKTRIERGSYKKDCKRSPEHCKNISIGRKGIKCKEETKIKISNTLKKRVLSEQSLLNIREGNRNKIYKHTYESRKKISESQKTDRNYMKGRKGSLHHLYGKKASKETIDKMRSTGRKIIDIDTGVIYSGMGECSEVNGIPKSTLWRHLNGKVKSKQNLRYYEKNY